MTNWKRNYGKFTLECWGNGLSYALTRNTTQELVFVQGDDALQFEHDKERAERAFPDKTNDEIMAWLWDQNEYGLAATQQEQV